MAAAAASDRAPATLQTPLEKRVLPDPATFLANRLQQVGFPEIVARAAATKAMGGSVDPALMPQLSRPAEYAQLWLHGVKTRISERAPSLEQAKTEEEFAAIARRPFRGGSLMIGGCEYFWGACSSFRPKLPPETDALIEARKSGRGFTSFPESNAAVDALIVQIHQGKLEPLSKALVGGEVEGLVYGHRVVCGVARTRILSALLQCPARTNEVMILGERLIGDHAEPFEPAQKISIRDGFICCEGPKPTPHLELLRLIIQAPESTRPDWEIRKPPQAIRDMSGSRFFSYIAMLKLVVIRMCDPSDFPNPALIQFLLGLNVLTISDLRQISAFYRGEAVQLPWHFKEITPELKHFASQPVSESEQARREQLLGLIETQIKVLDAG